MDDAPIRSLLDRASRGDQAAWDVLISRFEGLIWATVRAYRLEAGDAADVVQTVWLRLVEYLGRLRDPERLGGWLATTARHESLHCLRRSGRTVLTGDEADFEPRQPVGTPLDAGLLASERDAALWRALRAVSERCQRLLRTLAADPTPSYEEVGRALDMPVGSIGPTRARCLERLRAALAREGITETA